MLKHVDPINGGVRKNPVLPSLYESEGLHASVEPTPEEPAAVIIRPVEPRPRLALRLQAHYQAHPESYSRLSTYLMYAGSVLVVLLSVYLLIFGD